jgi:choline dehydrogenase-like flavoprotein
VNTHTVRTIAIVGAGTAGCVVAKSLLDALTGTQSAPRIVMIERGSFNPLHDAGDFMLSLTMESTAVTRVDATTSVSSMGEFPYVQARCVGGGGAVNGMVVSPLYVEDFEYWRNHYELGDWVPEELVTSADQLFVTTQLSDQHVGHVGRAVIASGGEPATLTWNGHRVSGQTLISEYIENETLELLQADVLGVVIDEGKVRGVVTDVGEIAADIVIMAAGAVMTPLLLQRSGVVHEHLGRNAQDHPSLFFPIARPDAFRGTLNATALHSMGDTQVIAYESANPHTPMWGGVSLSLLRVTSRGSIRGSHTSPKIDLCLLDSVEDRQLMRQSVRAFVTEHVPVIEHECGAVMCDDKGQSAYVLAEMDDHQLDVWLRAHVVPHSHISGTCAMGTGTEAVLTPRATVISVSGMYVADASVFPHLPRSNTNMVVASVAAQVARFIVEDLS